MIHKLRLTLILLAALSLAVSAQDAGYLDQLDVGPETPSFEKDVSVRLQLIDVSVQDGRGNYVTNLTRDDFTVRVNGEQVPIKTFDVYFSGKGPSLEDMAAGTIPNATSPTRRLVLFFDQAFSSFQGFRKAKYAALEFVKRSLRPGDEVMVVSYARSFKIHTEFTRDRELLEQVINDMTYMPVGTRGRGSAFPSENIHEVRVYLQALEDLSLYLDSWRGRKTFIMLSEGFAQTIAIYNLSSFHRDMIEQFKSSNLTIFSIDVAGLSGARAFSPRLASLRRDTLSTFAVSTGGKFYQGSNNIENMLLSIEEDISNYYVLGISVPDGRNGQFQEVDVETTRDDLELNYTDGFYSPKPFDEMNSKEQLVQLSEGFNLPTPIKEFEAFYSTGVFPRNDGSGVAMVVMRAPVNKQETQQYEVRGIVLNKDNDLIDGFHQVFQYQGDGDFYHEAYLNIEPGENLIKLVIRDNATGKRNYQFMYARMPPLSEGLHASTIMFTINEQHGREIFRSSRARSKDYRDDFNFSVSPPVNPLSTLSSGIVFASDQAITPTEGHGIVMKISGVASRQPSLTLEFTARDSNGNRIPVPVSSKSLRSVPGTGEVVITAQLDFTSLDYGDYLLQAKIEDTEQERLVSQQTRISVVSQ